MFKQASPLRPMAAASPAQNLLVEKDMMQGHAALRQRSTRCGSPDGAARRVDWLPATGAQPRNKAPSGDPPRLIHLMSSILAPV